MDINKQNQVAGDNSTQIQASTINNNYYTIAGVSEEIAREALRLAMHKLPCKCKIVSRADLEGGDNSEN